MSAPVLSRLFTAKGKATEATIPTLSHSAMHESTFQQNRPVASAQLSLQRGDPFTQPSEPILFPKLRIYFADFPYLHCSIDQRLLTLETCCGYEYERMLELFFPSDFQGPSGAHRTPHEVWCFTGHQTISPGNQIPWCQAVNKKRELFPGLLPTSPNSFALPQILNHE